MKITWTRLALLVLAVPFAWRWGPAFLDWLVAIAPSVGRGIVFLTPDLTGYSAAHSVKFIIAAVIFFLLFQLLRLMFGFAAPKAQMFGTTKLLRRFQGLIAETVVVALFIALSLQVAVWREAGKGRMIAARIDQAPPVEGPCFEAQQELAAARSEETTARENFYEDLAEFKKAIIARLHLPAFGAIGGPAAQSLRSYDERGVCLSMAPFGAPCDQFRSTEDQFLARWREIDVLGKKVRDLDARVNLLHAKIVAGTAEDQRRELVWEAAKAETLAHYAETFSLTWASILIYALLAYMLLGYWAKELLSKIYSALMRFLHKGRFGIGGSARFIGLVEEWSLRWKPKRALLPFYFDFLDLLKSKVPAEEEKPADDQDNTFRRRPRKPGLLAGLMPKKQALRESLTVEREYYGGGDLFIGRSLYHRGLHVGLKDDRHMMTIGGSRSGKGATAIIPNLLTFDGSVLCIDPKGENARITARRRREMGQKVHIVDPFHIVTEDSDCFNPLEHLEEKTRNGI